MQACGDMMRERSIDLFLDPLKTLMVHGPKPAAIAAWAQNNPGDWARTLSVMARLAGWSEKSEVLHKHKGVIGHIHAMSDAELLAEARNSLGSFDVLAIENAPQKACIEAETVPYSSSLDGSTDSQQD